MLENIVAFLSVLYIFGTRVKNTVTTQYYLSITLSQWLKPHGMASPALSTFMYEFRKMWLLLQEFYMINSKYILINNKLYIVIPRHSTGSQAGVVHKYRC